MQVNRLPLGAVGLGALAAFSLGAAGLPANAGAWSDLAPASRIGTNEDYGTGGLAVSGGRVWWLVDVRSSADGHPSIGAELRSRSLTGGRTRRTTLDLAAMQRPGPVTVNIDGVPSLLPGVAQFRMRAGRVFVTGLWVPPVPPVPPVVQPTSYVGFLAAFDARSGAVLRQDVLNYQEGSDQRTGGLPRFVSGNPAVLGPQRVGPQRVGPDQLRDPWSDAVFGARAPVVASTRVAGRFLLVYPNTFDSQVSWERERGALRVLDLASGAVRYRLTRAQVNRAAGAPRASSAVVTLREDGSLSVAIGGRAGKGVYPVAVDPRGRIRRIGRPVVGVRSVVTTIGHGRAFVLADAKRTVGGKTSYPQRLWITDLRGRRGRALPAVDRLGASVGGTPFFWDGRHAVYYTIGRRDQPGVRVDTGLNRMRLRAGEVPAR